MDDVQVRLVRDVQVNVVRLQPGDLQRFLDRVGHLPHRPGKHGPAIHLQVMHPSVQQFGGKGKRLPPAALVIRPPPPPSLPMQ